jgi:hypothetical protein
LKLLSPDAVVVVEGYESGFADVVEVPEGTLRPDVHKQWYYGRHEKAPANEPGTIKAAFIIGEKRDE